MGGGVTIEPLPASLRLVDDDGVVHAACPGCAQRDEVVERLQADVANLEAEARRYRRKISDLQRERHKDLHLHPRAETIRRVYGVWRRHCRPRAQEEIPDDRMRLGLDRTKDFTEEQMLRAVRGAASGLARDRTGKLFDDWENVFRNTRNVWIYIEHADRYDEQLRRRMPLGMHYLGVLRAAGRVDVLRSTEERVRADCPCCGGGLVLDMPSGVFLCRAGCDVLDLDEAFARLAEAHGLVAE